MEHAGNEDGRPVRLLEDMRAHSGVGTPPPPRTGAADPEPVEHGAVGAEPRRQPRPAGASRPDPLVEAYKRDVDRTLLRQNLRRSATERVENLMALQELAAEARRAGRRRTAVAAVRRAGRGQTAVAAEARPPRAAKTSRERGR